MLDAGLPASIKARVCGAALSAGTNLVEHSTKPAIAHNVKLEVGHCAWGVDLLYGMLKHPDLPCMVLLPSWYLPMTSLAQRPCPQSGQRGYYAMWHGAPHGPQVPRT